MGRFEDYLEQSYLDISINKPFFSRLLFGLHIHLIKKGEKSPYKTNFETAFTDCVENVWFYESFIDKLGYKVFNFIMEHELGHCLYLSNIRRKDRDPLKWNIASDYVINWDLYEMQQSDPALYNYYEIPNNCLLDKKYAGMTAEEVYDLIPDEDVEKLAQKGGIGDDVIDGDPDADMAVLAEKAMDRIVGAAEQEGYGSMSQGMARAVEEYRKPQMDWRALLHEYVEQFPEDYDYSRGDRRFDDVFVPTLGGERIEIAVGIDMSGSISQSTASDFIAEVMGVLKAYQNVSIMAFTFDTSVLVSQELVGPSDIDGFMKAMKGGGGTSFNRPIRQVQKREAIKAIVMFTDGHGDFPPVAAMTKPVLWIITKGGKAPDDKYGRHCFIS